LRQLKQLRIQVWISNRKYSTAAELNIQKITKQVAQLSQSDPLQGGLVLAKSGILELGDNILRTLKVYLQPLWRNWPASYQIQ